MKRSMIILAAASSALLICCSCERSSRGRDAFHVTVSAQGQNVSPQNKNLPADPEGNGKNAIPKLPPRDGETLLGLYSINLDADIEDEQVCILKRRDDSSSFIRVAVLDQKASSGNWVRIWDGATLATKYPTFNLTARDLLGFHAMDIICSGLNDSGRQTLSAFHPDPDGEGQIKGYSTIVSIEADAIEVRESERGEAYAFGQSEGDPLTVLSYEQDQGSTNYLDQIETEWTWKAARSAYEKGVPKRISGVNIERKVIERYLNRDAATFEGFLSGMWRLNLANAKGSDDNRIIQFDPANRTIAFSEKGDLASLSVFTWKDSQATKLGLFVSTQNEAVNSLKRFVEVELCGQDSISVRVIEDEYMRADPSSQWNGIYRKLVPGQQSSAAARTPKSLSGRFHSTVGADILFSPPRFEWKEGELAEQGVFSQYTLGEATVLVLKSMKASGIITRTRTFRIDRKDMRDSEGAFEELTLSPARTSAAGLELLDQEAIVLRLTR
jgi:hypothetical protein